MLKKKSIQVCMSCTVFGISKDHPDLRCHSCFLRDCTAISLCLTFSHCTMRFVSRSPAPRAPLFVTREAGCVFLSPGEACGVMSELQELRH